MEVVADAGSRIYSQTDAFTFLARPKASSTMLTRLQLAWRLYRDPRVAPRMKILLPVFALLYLIFPIDAIPDVLLGPGQLDDLTVIALVVVALGRLAKWAPVSVVEEHLAKMGKRPRGGSKSTDGNDVVEARYQVVDKR